jgi:hypothetical protein
LHAQLSGEGEEGEWAADETALKSHLVKPHRVLQEAVDWRRIRRGVQGWRE